MPSAEAPAFPRRILARELYNGVGDAPLADRLVEIAGGRIAAVRPAEPRDRADPATPVAEILAPGFIDLQINGANDAQFNFDPSAAAIARIAEGARRGGTAHLLPTFMTAPGRDYARGLAAARAAIDVGIPGIIGVHLEGPFLSPARPGIHEAAAIRPMDATDLELITAPFPGVVLATLAPERQPPQAVQSLIEAGVVVFAGHSDAGVEAIARAEEGGLRGATHLFNAMRQMTAREPGVVGGVLASPRLFAGIIADGHHVAWPNVAIAVRLMPDRLCLVTDAMLTLAGRSTEFRLHGARIRLAGGRLTNAEGRLAGAHVAMDACLRNIVRHAGAPIGAALRMASTNPARALGLQAELGAIRPGHRASLTLLDRALNASAVIVDGRMFGW